MRGLAPPQGASREVDREVAKVTREDADLALDLARRHRDEETALLHGFVVDEVVWSSGGTGVVR